MGSGVHDRHVGERVAALTPGGGLAEVAIVEPLESVAAIHDLLAAGRGSGKYVTKVHG